MEDQITAPLVDRPQPMRTNGSGTVRTKRHDRDVDAGMKEANATGDRSLRKTQSTNSEIPSRTEAVAPKHLRFDSISHKKATEIVIAKHYLHSKPPISSAFGIIRNDEIVGVCTFGKPMPSVQVGVTGGKMVDIEKKGKGRHKNVFELNRLWIADDVTDHCIESKFVAWCLRQLKKENPNQILVSYADGSITNSVTGKNHVGVVYQAVGFLYTGLSVEFTDITLQGYGDHRSVPKEMQGEKVGNRRTWADNPNVLREERSRKHRYVWFSNPRDAAFLGWDILPYPKKPAGCEADE
jgi:hypothetical protein